MTAAASSQVQALLAVMAAATFTAVAAARVSAAAASPVESLSSPPTPPAPGNLRTEAQLAGEHAFGCPPSNVQVEWQLGNSSSGNVRGRVQTAFRVQVSSQAGGAVVWDSGVIESWEQSAMAVNTTGHPTLSYESTYTWVVQVWEAVDGVPGPGPSAWSSPASFDVAPAPGSFAKTGAQWVGGNANQLQSAFTLPASAGPVTRARAYVTGLGAFYLWVNGHRVGDNVLDTSQTVYSTRVTYRTFDVTDLVAGASAASSADRAGPGDAKVVVGALIGSYKFSYMDVWCNVTAQGGDSNLCRGLMARFVVHLADGTVVEHVTAAGNSSTTFTTLPSGERLLAAPAADADASWHGRQSPITYDSFFHGESYDARLELAGWASQPASTFPAGTWAPVMQMHFKVGELVPDTVRPVRVWRQYPAVSVKPAPTWTCRAGVLGGIVPENSVLTLSCANPADIISAISFASFGTPSGACPAFAVDPTCNAASSMALVRAACVGKSSCAVNATNGAFGGDPCPSVHKRLAVIASGCTPPPPPKPASNSSSWIWDFGQNMNGYVTLQLPSGTPVGTNITLLHGEILHENGTVYNSYWSAPGSPWYSGCHQAWGGNCARQTDSFVSSRATTASGSTYTPWFTSHGFRYVQMWGWPSNLPSPPPLATLSAHFLSSDVSVTGQLTLPSVPANGTGTPDILNAIQHITAFAQRSQTFGGIMTDCPQRERRGWQGDAQMSANEASLNFDMRAQHRHFLQANRDDQMRGCQSAAHVTCNATDAVGSVGDVSPYTTPPYGGFPGSPVWMSAYPVILRQLWRNYADMPTLAKHFEGAGLLMDFMRRHANPASGLVEFGGLGDWNPPGGESTPTPSTSAFYWCVDLGYMADTAAALGLSANESAYRAEASDCVARWHTRFWNSSSQLYSLGSQTSSVMALALGAPPDAAVHNATVKALVTDIEGRGWHTTSGIIGATFVFDVLRAVGAGDVAMRMLLQDTEPSYGYMVAQGATTMWESYHGDRFNPAGSRNHIMFGGGVGTFTYSGLVGLDTTTNATHSGWRHMIAAPLPAAVTLLKQASGSVANRFGVAAVAYGAALSAGEDKEPLAVWVNVTVPPGSTATVEVPLVMVDQDGIHASNVSVVDYCAPADDEAMHGTVLWPHADAVPSASPAAGVRSAVAAMAPCGTPIVSLVVGSGSYCLHADAGGVGHG